MPSFLTRLMAWDQRRLLASMDRKEKRQAEVAKINHPNWPDPKFYIGPCSICGRPGLAGHRCDVDA